MNGRPTVLGEGRQYAATRALFEREQVCVSTFAKALITPVSDDRVWQILLQKSFWRDDRKLSGPLVRFARGDMRDHIVSRRNDHGASYRSYGVLQWQSRLKINVCEIFGVVRFSTFATISALSGHAAAFF
jgi:hypothetical protein